MRIPTSHLEGVLAVLGASTLALRQAVVNAAVPEPWIHTVRDVADTIVKVGGAGAIVAAVVFWILKKLLRPQIEAAIRSWFAPDIKKFRASLKRVQQCAESIAKHADGVEQSDDDFLLILEWIEIFTGLFDDQATLLEQFLGIERRRDQGDERRAIEMQLGQMIERRRSGHRFKTAHPAIAERLTERRRARERGDIRDELRDLTVTEDPTRRLESFDGDNGDDS